MASSAAHSVTPSQLPSAGDLHETWTFLREGTNHIMTRLRDGMTFAKYMELYTSVLTPLHPIYLSLFRSLQPVILGSQFLLRNPPILVLHTTIVPLLVFTPQEQMLSPHLPQLVAVSLDVILTPILLTSLSTIFRGEDLVLVMYRLPDQFLNAIYRWCKPYGLGPLPVLAALFRGTCQASARGKFNINFLRGFYPSIFGESLMRVLLESRPLKNSKVKNC